MVAKSRLQNEALIPGSTVPAYRYRFISVHEMNGWAAQLIGSGAGAPIIGENTTSSITGLRIQVDADSHAGIIALGDDVDVERDIDIKIIWSSDQTTTADQYTWTPTFTEMSLNGTSGINTAAATALSTAIAADANLATASAVQATEYGTITGGVLNGTIADGYLLNLLLTATTNGGTVISDLVIWYGIVLRYQPKKF